MNRPGATGANGAESNLDRVLNEARRRLSEESPDEGVNFYTGLIDFGFSTGSAVLGLAGMVG